VRLKIVACDVFLKELSSVVARSSHTIEMEWLPKRLHEEGGTAMRERLQQAIDATAASHEAILLAYGLCNNGLVGLAAPAMPLVALRAHDCITAFLGSRERYARYFAEYPGTYFLTTGWMEGAQAAGGALMLPTQVGGIPLDHDTLAARYGEDNARFLLQELGDPTRHYRRLAFIRTGTDPRNLHAQAAEHAAARRGWAYESIEGRLDLLDRLVNGPWETDEDFLVVPPGRKIAASHDERVLGLAEAER
jgi:hypothetical protein